MSDERGVITETIKIEAMKKIILGIILCLASAGCGSNRSGKAGLATEQPEHDRVEVLYFHGKRRCATCMAIEQRTKETLEGQFADELKDGSLIFRIIDISQPENEALADKYEVTWSSLHICRWKGGKETSENLTEFAFANARTAPEAFEAGLAARIRDLRK